MEFNYIVNPESGKKVSIYNATGKKVLQNYVKYLTKLGGNKKRNSKKRNSKKRNSKKRNSKKKKGGQRSRVKGGRRSKKKYAGSYKYFEKKLKRVFLDKEADKLLNYIKLNVKKNNFEIKNKKIYVKKQLGGALEPWLIGTLVAAGILFVAGTVGTGAYIYHKPQTPVRERVQLLPPALPESPESPGSPEDDDSDYVEEESPESPVPAYTPEDEKKLKEEQNRRALEEHSGSKPIIINEEYIYEKLHILFDDNLIDEVIKELKKIKFVKHPSIGEIIAVAKTIKMNKKKEAKAAEELYRHRGKTFVYKPKERFG